MIIREKFFLMVGGLGSVGIGILHLVAIGLGAEGYRLFGAGEAMAQKAEAGSFVPALMTFVIALIFFLWGVYAFSALDLFRPLPFRLPVLVGIAAIYLVRGLAILPLFLFTPERVDGFIVLTSFISLMIGLCYAWGTVLLEKKQDETGKNPGSNARLPQDKYGL